MVLKNVSKWKNKEKRRGKKSWIKFISIKIIKTEKSTEVKIMIEKKIKSCKKFSMR